MLTKQINPASRRGRLNESAGTIYARSWQVRQQELTFCPHSDLQHHREHKQAFPGTSTLPGNTWIIHFRHRNETPLPRTKTALTPTPSISDHEHIPTTTDYHHHMFTRYHKATPSSCQPQILKITSNPAKHITWQDVTFASCDRGGADSTEIQRVVQHCIYSAECLCIAASGKCRGIWAIPAVFYAPPSIFFLVKKNKY